MIDTEQLRRQALVSFAGATLEECAGEIERLRKIETAARNLSDSLDGGFVRCERCGDQEDTTDLDFAAELRAALNQQTPIQTEDDALDELSRSPRPHGVRRR